MRLLASVRSADEVPAAVSGGADIIDAKEPSRGSLGAVSTQVFARIQARVPLDLELSAALGDVTSPLEVHTSMAALLGGAPLLSSIFLKLGFSGVSRSRQIRALLELAGTAAGEMESPAPRVIAVAYADHENAGCADPGMIWDAAGEAGVAGVLMDTWSKGSRHLFDWIEPDRVRDLVNQARRAGLLTALAGGLGPEQLPAVYGVDPDIVGFRGALCQGGREGKINRARVRRLRTLLEVSGSVDQPDQPDKPSQVAKRPEPLRISPG
jgi:(5-formylfuran-3-yl)methyl phosphate synthase